MTAVTKKPRRLTERQVERVLAEFDLPGKVHALMTERKAIRAPEWQDGERWTHRWIIHTHAGPLSVHPYDDWIACRFDDADAGNVRVGATIPSGKWNHHAFVRLCHGPTSTTEMVEQLSACLAGFVERLGWIT